MSLSFFTEAEVVQTMNGSIKVFLKCLDWKNDLFVLSVLFFFFFLLLFHTYQFVKFFITVWKIHLKVKKMSKSSFNDKVVFFYHFIPFVWLFIKIILLKFIFFLKQFGVWMMVVHPDLYSRYFKSNTACIFTLHNMKSLLTNFTSALS